MPLAAIAAAVQRVTTAFARRPEVAVHEDAPATARWVGASRMEVRNPAGLGVATDMPVELGGTGDQVTPGWLMRAGMASCAATTIVLMAARAGMVLTTLEVRADSRSDARGLLGMSGADGVPVYAGPLDVAMHVRIAASGATPQALTALVEQCLGHSPVQSALTTATPFSLQIDIAA